MAFLFAGSVLPIGLDFGAIPGQELCCGQVEHMVRRVNKLRTFFSDQAYVRDSIVLRGGVIRTSLVIVFTLKCALNSKPSTG